MCSIRLFSRVKPGSSVQAGINRQCQPVGRQPTPGSADVAEIGVGHRLRMLGMIQHLCCMHRHCMFGRHCRSDASHVQREELEALAVSSESILASTARAAERAKHNLAPPLQALAEEEPHPGHRVRLPESLLHQAGTGHASCQYGATVCPPVATQVLGCNSS